jgi:Fe-Mn family superoxide dismutase
MQKYEAKTFNIPELKGISTQNIEEHMKLYQGYVKHANLILEHIDELVKDADPSIPKGSEQAKAYELGEINRRFSFEFNGMRNHEIYFGELEGASAPLSAGGELYMAIEKSGGSLETFMNRFKSIALTRGIGWAILYYDPVAKDLVTAWVDEQHLGQLSGCLPVLALDMWEHSYVADYQPSGKKQYIEDFFSNLNWKFVEKNYDEAVSK